MVSSSIGIRIEAELGSIAERCGCELLDATLAGGILRLVVDREEGITVDDCARVSREASALLDVEDFSSGRYVLEVSSPGLDREFYREADYQRFAGEQIRITWRDSETGKRRTDVGRLNGISDQQAEHVEVTTEHETLTIRLSDVDKARLEPEF